MLQTFAGERCATSGSTEQESLRAKIACGPDEVANALESEHRVVDEHRDRVDPVRRVGRSCGDERRHRTGFGDSLFEDLAVLRFLVIEQRVDIDRLIELPDVRVDSHLSEQRFHAERTSFVGDDGNDQMSDGFVTQHLREHANKDHRGRSLAAFGALGELFEDLSRNADWDGSLRHVSARIRRVPRVALSDTASPDCPQAADRTAGWRFRRRRLECRSANGTHAALLR